jgi:hypothetical protein
MVNPISYPGMAADTAPKLGSGVSSGGTPVKINTPAPQQPQVSEAQIEQKVALKVATAAAPPLVGGGPGNLAPPLTSLALWRDGESGMQVAVVRDRVSGQVVEQFPTERARRLAAMVRQQEMLAQELQRQQVDTPHIDVKT